MKRNGANLRKYKKTCKAVLKRSDGVCEVLINGERCGKYIGEDNAKYINFMHKGSRNGESDEWILNPDNIIFGCEEHHIEDPTGNDIEGVEYDDEITYVPDEQ